MPGWFDQQGITGYEPIGPPDGGFAPNENLPIDPPAGQAAAPAPARPQFDFTNASVHGRNANPNDANDLLWLASQQPGFDISSNQAAQQTFQNIIQPMFAQQGMNPQLGGRNSDRLIMPGGRVLDFVANAGEQDTSKRRMWVGDSALSGPDIPRPTLGSLGDPLPMPSFGGVPGGMPGLGSGGPAPSTYTGPETPGVSYNPMAEPSPYTPQAVAGPAPLSLASIAQPGGVRADLVGPGSPVQPGTVQPGERVNAERVNAERVGSPDAVRAERLSRPEALTAQQLADPGAFRNMTAADLPLDPSYQFRRDQTLGALENSASAKGMTFHPNTIRGLQETAGNLASQEYAAANARNLAVQQQNFANQAAVAGQNNAANAQAYGLTNQYQQSAALANQQTDLQAQLANQQARQQAGMFNAGQGQQAQLANQGANLAAGQFNSGQQQQVNLANVGNQFQGQQFNAAQAQQAALANQGANLQAGTFNAGMDFNTQQQNVANQLAGYNAYQPLAQQNAQFNAGQQTAANQNNFANQFAVNQANNAGTLGAFNANLGAELGRGNLALGNLQANQSYALGQGNLGLGYGQLALGNRQADQSYDLGLRSNALGYGNLGVAQGQLGLAAQGQAFNQDLSTFNTNYGVFRDNRDTAFNQNYSLAALGAGAAGNYGQQAGNLYANQGAANANAGLASAGAWSGALGTIGNVAGQGLMDWANPPVPGNVGYPQIPGGRG